MLSSSPLKIHEPRVTGVSPPPTDRRQRQKTAKHERRLWVPRTVSRLLTSAFVVARARRPPVRRDLRLQQKGPADPLTTCSAHEDRPRRDRDLEEAANPTDLNSAEQRSTSPENWSRT